MVGAWMHWPMDGLEHGGYHGWGMDPHSNGCIVSSRTHGLFVHLSQRRNVGKTLIYVHKRIKNTPRALERSGGGVQRYTYATPWHCSLCESYEKICECGLPFTHSAQDANRPVRVVKCCSVDAKRL